MPQDPTAYFKLRKPCSNCPFLKDGAIELNPGRVEGIIEDLLVDDHSSFYCHKTVHNDKSGGEWDEEGEYHATGKESMCAGAMIYLEKVGRPNVPMRLGRAYRIYSPDVLAPHFDKVIEPLNGDTAPPRPFRRPKKTNE
jgi:hypothetical protein